MMEVSSSERDSNLNTNIRLVNEEEILLICYVRNACFHFRREIETIGWRGEFFMSLCNWKVLYRHSRILFNKVRETKMLKGKVRDPFLVRRPNEPNWNNGESR